MDTSLSEAELKIMDVAWDESGASARHIADVLARSCGYSLSATYTLIGRCVKKGALRRVDPGYLCEPLVSREEIQNRETDGLVDRLFAGSVDKLFASLVSRGKLTGEQIDRLRSQADRIAS